MSARPPVPRVALRPEEAAGALGLSKSMFYRDVLPELRCVYVGRVRLVPLAELELWVDRQAVRG